MERLCRKRLPELLTVTTILLNMAQAARLGRQALPAQEPQREKEEGKADLKSAYRRCNRRIALAEIAAALAVAYPHLTAAEATPEKRAWFPTALGWD